MKGAVLKRLSIIGLAAACFVTGNAIAASAIQLECAYDKTNAKSLTAVVKMLSDRDESRAAANEARVDRLIAPIISGCAKRHGWDDADKENARRHYVAQGMQRVMSGLLTFYKVRVDRVDAVYKAEPMTRAELSESLNDADYRKELADKIIALKIGANTADKANLAIAYMEIRLLTEDLVILKMALCENRCWLRRQVFCAIPCSIFL
jgi:hypothetical protein